MLHIEPDEDENNNSGDNAEFGKCLSLAIAYAANIGGIATLTGTGPNLVFKNIIDEYVPAMCSSVPFNLHVARTSYHP